MGVHSGVIIASSVRPQRSKFVTRLVWTMLNAQRPITTRRASAMKTLLMYERLVPIDREKHRQLRIHQGPGRLGFARETNSMLLAATELPLAALDYPCVFVQSGDQHTLITVVGLRDKENLLINEAGDWAEHSYVPAFVRRYPFVLAEQPGSQEMTLCVDEAFDGLEHGRGPAQGEALFDEQGQNTVYLGQLQAFLLSFHQDMLATAKFAQRLAELGLLVERSIARSTASG
jgi:hypothetical protein